MNTNVTVQDLYEIVLKLMGFGPTQILHCLNRCFAQAWDASMSPGFEFAEGQNAFALATIQELLCRQYIYDLASAIAMLDLNPDDIENLGKPVPPEVADAQPTKAQRKIG